MHNRGKLGADTLIKIILVLVAVWLVLSVASEVLDLFGEILGPLQPVLGLVVLLVIVLWLLDRI